MPRTLIPQLRAALILVVGVSSLATAQDATSAPAPRPAGPPSKTWEKSLALAVRPTPAGVKYQLNVSESPIEAGTMAEFAEKRAAASRNMVELRSGRSPGSYQWRLETPWEQQTHLSRCQFNKLDVRIGYDADIVMLAGPLAQDSTAIAYWEQQADAVYAQHLARLRLMRDAGRALYQKLRLMSNASCGELANIANNARREASFELNEKMRALGGPVMPIDDRAR